MPYSDYRTPRQFCPRCEKLLDAATGKNKGPAEGDFTMCVYCGHVMKFDKFLRLTEVTDEEFEEVREELEGYSNGTSIARPRKD